MECSFVPQERVIESLPWRTDQDQILTTYPFHLTLSKGNGLSETKLVPIFYQLRCEQARMLRSNPHVSNWELSFLAVDQGWVELLSDLLERFDFYHSLSLVYRIIQAHRDPSVMEEMIKIVLSKVKIVPTVLAATVFFEAIKVNHLPLIQLLLTDYRFDLRPYLEGGLSLALKRGHRRIVRVLIQEPTLSFIGKREILVALSVAYGH